MEKERVRSLSKSVKWETGSELEERVNYYNRQDPESTHTRQTANEITRNFLINKYNKIRKITEKLQTVNDSPCKPQPNKGKDLTKSYY